MYTDSGRHVNLYNYQGMGMRRADSLICSRRHGKAQSHLERANESRNYTNHKVRKQVHTPHSHSRPTKCIGRTYLHSHLHSGKRKDILKRQGVVCQTVFDFVVSHCKTNPKAPPPHEDMSLLLLFIHVPGADCFC